MMPESVEASPQSILHSPVTADFKSEKLENKSSNDDYITSADFKSEKHENNSTNDDYSFAYDYSPTNDTTKKERHKESQKKSAKKDKKLKSEHWKVIENYQKSHQKKKKKIDAKVEKHKQKGNKGQKKGNKPNRKRDKKGINSKSKGQKKSSTEKKEQKGDYTDNMKEKIVEKKQNKEKNDTIGQNDILSIYNKAMQTAIHAAGVGLKERTAPVVINAAGNAIVEHSAAAASIDTAQAAAAVSIDRTVGGNAQNAANKDETDRMKDVVNAVQKINKRPDNIKTSVNTSRQGSVWKVCLFKINHNIFMHNRFP